MTRIASDAEPFVDSARSWLERGTWPASWIDHPERPQERSSAALFQLEFSCAAQATSVIHVSADNRYQLYLDGKHLGRGPERSSPDGWCYESYQLKLSPGPHHLTALTWWQAGEDAPCAQMTVRPAFLLTAEGDLQKTLSTGKGNWQCSLVEGVEFLPAVHAPWTGAKVRIDAHRYPWQWEQGKHRSWTVPVDVGAAVSAALKKEHSRQWLLAPAQLPPMRLEHLQTGRVRHVCRENLPYPVQVNHHLQEESPGWQKLLQGEKSLVIPSKTSRSVVIDLEDYYCAFPEITVSGGAGSRIRLLWSESLVRMPVPGKHGILKDNRDTVEGKTFLGVGDEFLPDGGAGRRFTTLWWEAGRYLELTVTTADQPLIFENFAIVETGYPYDVQHEFRCSDERLEKVIPPAFRALQMCSHETYMDCPWYEQLMYVGDTRLECLVTHVLTRDYRLPRKALSVFDQSRLPSGWTQSRYPARVLQVIPPFSLWYVCMAHDYWMWRDDADFVRSLLPGIRGILEAARTTLGPDNLLHAPSGWNFVDWVPGWDSQGMPPGADLGTSSVINLQFVLALQAKADLEEAFGEPLLASRDRSTAQQTLNAVLGAFYDPARGLLADDREHTSWSEHPQCLALLTGLLPEQARASVAEGLLSDSDLFRTTVYFTHYLFETMRVLRRPDKILERMQLWFDLEKHGFKTTPEMPEPSRSDCHAWGAHPIFHYSATLAGIRPACPGFTEVAITPQLGPLEWLETTVPHPSGLIHVRLERHGQDVRADVILPEAVTGTFHGTESTHRLGSGHTTVILHNEVEQIHA